ncbi:MAG: Nif3-like dinuclear metal center hexameric protein [Pseudomonadota bacterium]
MKLSEIVRYLDELLHTEPMKDVALNGLQVGGDWEVGRVGVAVDARLTTFRAAAKAGCGLVVVHHGLFWGGAFPWTGAEYARIAFLTEHRLGLYASHLPLDAHPTLGNNARLLLGLGVTPKEPFGDYHGLAVGWWGELEAPEPRDALMDRVRRVLGGPADLLPFGPPEVRRVAVLSGGGGGPDVLSALRAGADLMLTGEASHQLHALAEDWGVNLAFGGHYATESFGVQAVGRRLEEDLGLETVFLPCPTGL